MNITICAIFIILFSERILFSLMHVTRIKYSLSESERVGLPWHLGLQEKNGNKLLQTTEDVRLFLIEYNRAKGCIQSTIKYMYL